MGREEEDKEEEDENDVFQKLARIEDFAAIGWQSGPGGWPGGVHSGANFRFFVWLSTDKKKDNVFVYTFYKLGQILKEICVDLLNQV